MVIVSAGSSSRSEATAILKTAEAERRPAGRTSVKSGTAV